MIPSIPFHAFLTLIFLILQLCCSYQTSTKLQHFPLIDGDYGYDSSFETFNVKEGELSTNLQLKFFQNCSHLKHTVFLRPLGVPYSDYSTSYNVPFTVHDNNQLKFIVSNTSLNYKIKKNDMVYDVSISGALRHVELNVKINWPVFGNWFFIVSSKNVTKPKDEIACRSKVFPTVYHVFRSKNHRFLKPLVLNEKEISFTRLIEANLTRKDFEANRNFVLYKVPIQNSDINAHIVQVVFTIHECSCVDPKDHRCLLNFGTSMAFDKFPSGQDFFYECNPFKESQVFKKFIALESNDNGILLVFNDFLPISEVRFSLDIQLLQSCLVNTEPLEIGRDKNLDLDNYYKSLKNKRLSLLQLINPDAAQLVEKYVMDQPLPDLPHQSRNFFTQRCHLYVHPSKYQYHDPLLFDFIFRPTMPHLANSLRINAWEHYIVPIELKENEEIGGTLEISLQLNSLDETVMHNSTHVKSLSRQVILYACFSDTFSKIPNSKECHHWLRLATVDGVYSSVLNAVHVAIGNTENAPFDDLNRVKRDFNSSIDRSYIYFPYPRYGKWYLTLYAECYSKEVYCDPKYTIKVGLVIRSSPCLKFRCRDIGEGSTLFPSRLMNPDTPKYRPAPTAEGESRAKKQRDLAPISMIYRPEWWWSDELRLKNNSYPDEFFETSPAKSSQSDSDMGSGFGFCTKFMIKSLKISKCSCMNDRFGVGCRKYHQPKNNLTSRKNLSSGVDVVSTSVYSRFSTDTVLLAISNLSFLPAIFLAVTRRLWGPALAYSYTFVFSIMHHVCDTESSSQYSAAFNFQTGPTIRSHDVYLEKESLSDFYSNFFSTSAGSVDHSYICPLPRDSLSFCDFFGGIFSISITLITTAALPSPFSESLLLLSVFGLTVGLHVARYSAVTFTIPLVSGLTVNLISWITWSYKLKRLFPPVQWYFLGLLPGLIISSIGLIIFVHPNMKQNYTLMHSIWHIMIGLSLLFILPRPSKWRLALYPVCSLHKYLSCGGHKTMEYDSTSSIEDINENNQSPDSGMSSNESSRTRFLFGGSKSRVYDSSQSEKRSTHPKKSRVFLKLSKVYYRLKSSYLNISEKFDQILELNFILDRIMVKMPRLARLIIPYGYKSKLKNYKKESTEDERLSPITPETVDEPTTTADNQTEDSNP